MKRTFVISMMLIFFVFKSFGVGNEEIVMATVVDVIDETRTSHDDVYQQRFAWGLDAGSAIDLTGNDMSAIDINACFGYSGPYVRMLGLGAAIDMMVSSSSTSYPVYVLYRTDFSKRSQLCFMEVKSGMAFTNIGNYERQSTPYASLGVGVTLATGHTFSSHIILSYCFTRLDDVNLADGKRVRIHDLQYATLKIGIAF